MEETETEDRKSKETEEQMKRSGKSSSPTERRRREEQSPRRRDVLERTGAGLAGLSALPFIISDDASAQSQQSDELPSPISTLPLSYRPSASGVTVVQPEDAKTRHVAQQLGLRLVALVPSERGSEGAKQPLVLGRDGDAAEFSVVVDSETQTYSIENLEILVTSSTSNETRPESTSYYGPFTVVITTHDPAECRLARTKQTLEWAYDSNYATTYMTDRSMYTRAWAPVDHCEGGTAHFINTHWYEDWSKFVGHEDGSDSCYTECEAQYYNDDYGDNDHRTYSWHKLHITGYEGGTKDYWGTHDNWGEENDKLHVHVRKE